jgi:hypothetical protein
LPDDRGVARRLDMLSKRDALLLVQLLDTPSARRLQTWLAEAGNQRLDEMDHPELAFLRAAKLYQRKGHSRQWIDKRLRGVSARRELTSEWRKRGITEGDEYRALTNELMQSGFGMDVNAYRQQKNLNRPADSLRDHMNDLELILTTLAETAAVTLHRDRGSTKYSDLLTDVHDAGRVTEQTRRALEDTRGMPVAGAQQLAADHSASKPAGRRRGAA